MNSYLKNLGKLIAACFIVGVGIMILFYVIPWLANDVLSLEISSRVGGFIFALALLLLLPAISDFD